MYIHIDFYAFLHCCKEKEILLVFNNDESNISKRDVLYITEDEMVNWFVDSFCVDTSGLVKVYLSPYIFND